jgi:tyrosinase
MTSAPAQMLNMKLSPGDPVFFLHHAWLDRLWWLWQSQDPETRLAEVGGPNIPASTLPPFLSGPDATFMPPTDPSCASRGPGGTASIETSSIAKRAISSQGLPNQGIRAPPAPFPSLTDYFNDGGNITTLNHTLWSANLLPNVTIRDVMDINSPFVCFDYM